MSDNHKLWLGDFAINHDNHAPVDGGNKAFNPELGSRISTSYVSYPTDMTDISEESKAFSGESPFRSLPQDSHQGTYLPSAGDHSKTYEHSDLACQEKNYKYQGMNEGYHFLFDNTVSPPDNILPYGCKLSPGNIIGSNFMYSDNENQETGANDLLAAHPCFQSNEAKNTVTRNSSPKHQTSPSTVTKPISFGMSGQNYSHVQTGIKREFLDDSESSAPSVVAKRTTYDYAFDPRDYLRDPRASQYNFHESYPGYGLPQSPELLPLPPVLDLRPNQENSLMSLSTKPNSFALSGQNLNQTGIKREFVGDFESNASPATSSCGYAIDARNCLIDPCASQYNFQESYRHDQGQGYGFPQSLVPLLPPAPFNTVKSYNKKQTNTTMTTDPNAERIHEENMRIEKYVRTFDMVGSIPDTFLHIEKQLNLVLNQIQFAEPVTHVYNPTDYAHIPHKHYVMKYCNTRKEILFIGMNPGPFGMSQNGVSIAI
jgi:hypothetical protein